MKVVFDVGAAQGYEISRIAREHPDWLFYNFEPLPELFEILNSNTKGLGNCKNYKLAVDCEEGETDFHVLRYERSSGIAPMINKEKWASVNGKLSDFDITRKIKVNRIRLDNFIHKEKVVYPIHYVKVDAQGHDLQVLQSLGFWLYYVEHVKIEVQVTEFKVYEHACTLEEAFEFMKAHGFTCFHRQYQSNGGEMNIWFHNKRFDRKPELLFI